MENKQAYCFRHPISKSGNRRVHWLFAVFVVFLFFNCSFPSDSELIFRRMLVEYAENPINIDVAQPRFSWVVSSGERNQIQKSYQVLVASSPDKLKRNQADCWDSGKIGSAETIQHEYAGKDLVSNQKYFWKVMLWDGNGKEHESPVAYFETAILNFKEWKANWIGNGPGTELLPEKDFMEV